MRAFKDALGLADEDAAPVHIDAGRRLMRSRLEAGTRGGDFEQRRALQKLIYVSTLVFGDQKAAFLLPWRRVFGMSDAQLYIARRDNAKALFRSLLDARGGGLPARARPPLPPHARRLGDLRGWRSIAGAACSGPPVRCTAGHCEGRAAASRSRSTWCRCGVAHAQGLTPGADLEAMARQAERAALAEVRAAQQRVRLEDDAAAEAVKEAARAAAEGMLDRGLECLKRRTRVRDYSDALQVPGVLWIALYMCFCRAACPPLSLAKGTAGVCCKDTYKGNKAPRGAAGPLVWYHDPGRLQAMLGQHLTCDASHIEARAAPWSSRGRPLWRAGGVGGAGLQPRAGQPGGR